MPRPKDNRFNPTEPYAPEAAMHRAYISDIERGTLYPTVTVVEKLASRSA